MTWAELSIGPTRLNVNFFLTEVPEMAYSIELSRPLSKVISIKPTGNAKQGCRLAIDFYATRLIR